VDIELLNDGGNNDDIQSIMTYDEKVIRDNTNIHIPPTLSAALTDPNVGGSRHNMDNDNVTSSMIHPPKFIGRSADSDRNLFEV
jgi:hypothetical protein